MKIFSRYTFPMTDADSDPLLADLTAPQREAVMHVDGPLLILAGAGSGKTRVITRRIANLVLRVGIPPWNVLAITFTNKAAGEMRERIAKLVSEKQARALTVTTFHALGARITRQYADRLGLQPGYTIYDTADQQRVVKTALEQLQMSGDHFPPAKVLGTISNAKNELIDPAAYLQGAHDFYSRNVAKIYAKYQQLMAANVAVDFDDLLIKTVELLKHHPDALAALREKYQFILIDEYQDTNHAQFIIAHTLAVERQNICATGDPDQSIYGWRGANIRNILEFEEHYPRAKVVRLEQNYRSTKHILSVADGLIRNNTQRKHKSLWTENEEGEPVRIVMTYDEKKEARLVVDRFEDLHKSTGMPWSSMAVFYRMNSLSRVMEDTLRTAGIPYQIARGTAFYERKEIKDAVSYLRVVSNPADEVNLLRVINTPPRGISETSVKALQAHAVGNQMTVYEATYHAQHIPAINTRAVKSVTGFSKMVDEWRNVAGVAGPADPAPAEEPAAPEPEEPWELSDALAEPSEPQEGDESDASSDVGDSGQVRSTFHSPSLRGFVERILRESGLEDHYRNDKTDPDGERLANLGELVTSAQQFDEEFDAQNDGREAPLSEKLAGYLERISLVSDVDGVNSTQGSVTLMTLHAAKGLEFPAIAIIGVEDGLLPHQRASNSKTELEEERRLCFVGITRAQKQLFLTHARFRTVFGQVMPTIPSRFLRELPPTSVIREDFSKEEDDWLAGDDRFSGMSQSRKDAESRTHEFPPGTKVRHAQFGVGRVLSVQAAGAQTRVQVSFQAGGVRTLILQYAKLEKL